MSAQRQPRMDRIEESTLRMSIKTLESRAAVSDRVTVSAAFAKAVARLLRRLLDKEAV